MTEFTEKRIMAFLRTFADRCSFCLRRIPDNCYDCPANTAKNIIAAYEQEALIDTHVSIDYSLAAREKMIIEALRKAEKPLTAHDIDLHDYCTPQLKHWTLKRMMRYGFIVRRKTKDRFGKLHWGYLLNNKETKNENNRTGTGKR
jgi:predicted transcriptional regulator